MLIFVHMHKCAGTAVRLAAQRSGFKLPARHRNGYLVDAEGEALRFVGMKRPRFDRLMTTQQRRGVTFFSMEWDFPPIDFFEPYDVRLFTVLRNPLDRAISNYRYAKLRGRIPKTRTFRQLYKIENRSNALSRAPNYFIRKLCSLSALAPITEQHLEHAAEILRQFKVVSVIGHHNLDADLQQLGITGLTQTNVTSKLATEPNISPADIEVSAEDKAWYCEHNAFDIELVNLYAKSDSTGRRATQPEAASASSESAVPRT